MTQSLDNAGHYNHNILRIGGKANLRKLYEKIAYPKNTVRIKFGFLRLILA